MALTEETPALLPCPWWCTNSYPRGCAASGDWHWGSDRQLTLTVTAPEDRHEPDVLDISIASSRLAPEDAHIWLSQEQVGSELRFTAGEARRLAQYLIELAAELDELTVVAS